MQEKAAMIPAKYVIHAVDHAFAEEEVHYQIKPRTTGQSVDRSRIARMTGQKLSSSFPAAHFRTRFLLRA